MLEGGTKKPRPTRVRKATLPQPGSKSTITPECLAGYAIEYDDDKHTYHLLENGERSRVPSVTTILNKCVPKPALVKWAWQRGIEGAWKVMTSEDPARSQWELENKVVNAGMGIGFKDRQTAEMTRGTMAHAVAEAYAKEGLAAARTFTRNLSGDLRGYGRAVLGFFDDAEPEVIGSEVILGSRENTYAGTTDLISRRRDGRVFLSDFKTGKALYGEVGIQLSAYRIAYEEMTGEKIDALSGIRLGKDGGFEEIEFEEPTGVFVNMVSIYRSGVLDYRPGKKKA
jgi:hypothetical protein